MTQPTRGADDEHGRRNDFGKRVERLANRRAAQADRRGFGVRHVGALLREHIGVALHVLGARALKRRRDAEHGLPSPKFRVRVRLDDDAAKVKSHASAVDDAAHERPKHPRTLVAVQILGVHRIQRARAHLHQHARPRRIDLAVAPNVRPKARPRAPREASNLARERPRARRVRRPKPSRRRDGRDDDARGRALREHGPSESTHGAPRCARRRRRRRRLRYSSSSSSPIFVGSRSARETASDDAPSRVARVGSRAHRATARHRRDRHFFPASSSRPRRPSRRVAAKTKVNARRARTDAGDRRRVPGCTS